MVTDDGRKDTARFKISAIFLCKCDTANRKVRKVQKKQGTYQSAKMLVFAKSCGKKKLKRSTLGLVGLGWVGKVVEMEAAVMVEEEREEGVVVGMVVVQVAMGWAD